MTFPCEYCGRPVPDAETFMRLGVWPCCSGCQRVPLVFGLVLFAGSVALMVGAFIALR